MTAGVVASARNSEVAASDQGSSPRRSVWSVSGTAVTLSVDRRGCRETTRPRAPGARFPVLVAGRARHVDQPPDAGGGDRLGGLRPAPQHPPPRLDRPRRVSADVRLRPPGGPTGRSPAAPAG